MRNRKAHRISKVSTGIMNTVHAVRDPLKGTLPAVIPDIWIHRPITMSFQQPRNSLQQVVFNLSINASTCATIALHIMRHAQAGEAHSINCFPRLSWLPQFDRENMKYRVLSGRSHCEERNRNFSIAPCMGELYSFMHISDVSWIHKHISYLNIPLLHDWTRTFLSFQNLQPS